MAAWTLAQAQDYLAKWLSAAEAIATIGQSYTIEIANTKRIVTHADIKYVHEQINFWRREVERLSAGTKGPRVKYIIPRD